MKKTNKDLIKIVGGVLMIKSVALAPLGILLVADGFNLTRSLKL